MVFFSPSRAHARIYTDTHSVDVYIIYINIYIYIRLRISVLWLWFGFHLVMVWLWFGYALVFHKKRGRHQTPSSASWSAARSVALVQVRRKAATPVPRIPML